MIHADNPLPSIRHLIQRIRNLQPLSVPEKLNELAKQVAAKESREMTSEEIEEWAHRLAQEVANL